MFKGLRYALPELAINGIEVFLRLYLLLYYTQQVGLDPKLAGLALGIATFWDAFTDPLVGLWSDQFKAKKGRRDILFLIGAALSSVALLGLFYPFAMEQQSAKFFYLLLGMMTLNTATTLFSVPYAAMVGDFAIREDERTKLIGWRLVFANLGALLGIAIPGFFVLQNAQTSNLASAQLFAGMAVVVSFLTFLFIKNWPREIAKESGVDFKQQWQMQVKNLNSPHILFLILAYLIANIGLTLNSSLALLYYRERLKLPENQIQSILLIFFIIFSLSIPLWIVLAKGRDKIKMGALGILALGISNCFVYVFLPPQSFVLTLLGASIIGGLLVGSYVLLESALAEITKENDNKAGTDSLGFFYGIWKMSGKISRGFALFFTGYIIAWVTPAQADGQTYNSDLLALFFGPGVGIFFVLAALVTFRISKKYERSFK